MRLIWLCLLAVGFLQGSMIARAGPSESTTAQVWVARRGWHIDLGLAVEQLHGPLTP